MDEISTLEIYRKYKESIKEKKMQLDNGDETVHLEKETAEYTHHVQM